MINANEIFIRRPLLMRAFYSNVIVLALFLTSQVYGENKQRVDISNRLGNRIPLNLEFVNEKDENAQLADFFQANKPVLLNLYYSSCPKLCSEVLKGITESIQKLEWIPGKHYKLLNISIDPQESPALAKAKKMFYLDNVAKKWPEAEWSFLVGDKEAIDRLSQALGFYYFYDKRYNQYVHPAVLYVLTSDGVISQYLHGTQFDKIQLSTALSEAATGRVGGFMKRMLLRCYIYDPFSNSHIFSAKRAMTFGGVIIVLGISLFLIVFWGKEWSKYLKYKAKGCSTR